MVNPLRWRGHEVSRLEAFSDTVFAFALTLLVVALEVPRDYDKLIDLLMGFPAFACGFGLLVWIWAQHNAFFRRFGMQDSYTVTLNAVLLFVVLLYVYPLKFMFDSLFAGLLPTRAGAPHPMQAYQLANASAIYAVGFMAVFVVFALLYHHASPLPGGAGALGAGHLRGPFGHRPSPGQRQCRAAVADSGADHPDPAGAAGPHRLQSPGPGALGLGGAVGPAPAGAQDPARRRCWCGGRPGSPGVVSVSSRHTAS